MMELSSLTRPENLFHCPYGDPREMADMCHYVWLRYFDTVKTGWPPCDVVIWEVGPRVSVRPASSLVDESSKTFVRPLPIYFELRGLAAERRRIERHNRVGSEVIAQQLAELDRELHAQMRQAILDGFNHRHVVAGYREFQDVPLTVVITSRDDGLQESELELVWKNKSGPSLELVRERATASKGRALPTHKRNPSIRERRMERLKEERKQWHAAAKRGLARQEEMVEQYTPRIRRRLLTAIESQEQRRQQLLTKPPRRQTPEASGFLLSLDDGNQLERLVVPKVHVDQLAAIIAKHPWSAFDEYDNRMWEYVKHLMAPAVSKAQVTSRTEPWLKLNRPQKVLHAMLSFSGETDNGGVWQFLFNEPRLSLAALEAMEEAGEARLAGDYRATLEELLGNAKTISEIRRKAHDSGLNTQEGWRAFAEGYREVSSARKIEKYFFTVTFKKRLYKRISDYAESQLHLLAEIQSQE